MDDFEKALEDQAVHPSTATNKDYFHGGARWAKEWSDENIIRHKDRDFYEVEQQRDSLKAQNTELLSQAKSMHEHLNELMMGEYLEHPWPAVDMAIANFNTYLDKLEGE